MEKLFIEPEETFSFTFFCASATTVAETSTYAKHATCSATEKEGTIHKDHAVLGLLQTLNTWIWIWLDFISGPGLFTVQLWITMWKQQVHQLKQNTYSSPCVL